MSHYLGGRRPAEANPDFRSAQNFEGFLIFSTFFPIINVLWRQVFVDENWRVVGAENFATSRCCRFEPFILSMHEAPYGKSAQT
jgi:hypothetical protein